MIVTSFDIFVLLDRNVVFTDEFGDLLRKFSVHMESRLEKLTKTHENELHELVNLKINFKRNAERSRSTNFCFS